MTDLVRTPEGYRPPEGSGNINGAINVGGGPGEIAAGVAGDQIRERTITCPDGTIHVQTVGDTVEIKATTTPVPASAGPAVFNGRFTFRPWAIRSKSRPPQRPCPRRLGRRCSTDPEPRATIRGCAWDKPRAHRRLFFSVGPGSRCPQMAREKSPPCVLGAGKARPRLPILKFTVFRATGSPARPR